MQELTHLSGDISSYIAQLEKSYSNYETSFLVVVRNFSTSLECVKSFNTDPQSSPRNAVDAWEFSTLFSIKLYPNGDCKENEGYISVFFNFYQTFSELKIKRLSLTAVVSVVDCEKNLRYLQSFAGNHDLTKEWSNLEEAHYRLGLERYLKRRTILNSNDLLQGDSLVIKCDVLFSFDPSPQRVSRFRDLFCEQEKREGWILREEKFLPKMLKRFSTQKRFEHSLNFANKKNPIVLGLKGKSGYFEKLFETSLDESKKKLLRIREEEYEAFFNMLCYVRFDTLNHVWTNKEYFDLYVISDKYELVDLKQRCSEYIKHNMTPNTAAEILVLSDLCNDQSLKSSVINYIHENKYDVIKSDGWKWLIKEKKCLAREVIPVDGEFLPVEGAQIDWFDCKNYFRIKRNLVSSDFSAQGAKNSLNSRDGRPLVQSCPPVQRETKPINVNTLEERDFQTDLVDRETNKQEMVKISHDDQIETSIDVSTFDFYS